MTSPSGMSRRRALGLAAAAAATPLVVARPALAQEPSQKTYDLTVLGTSDIHGNVYNWDYYLDAEYDDKAHNDIGLAKAATLVNQIRAERGHGPP